MQKFAAAAKAPAAPLIKSSKNTHTDGEPGGGVRPLICSASRLTARRPVWATKTAANAWWGALSCGAHCATTLCTLSGMAGSMHPYGELIR